MKWQADREKLTAALRAMWFIPLALLVVYAMTLIPRTPADWKAGYEQSVKEEQARHAEAMGMERGRDHSRPDYPGQNIRGVTPSISGGGRTFSPAKPADLAREVRR